MKTAVLDALLFLLYRIVLIAVSFLEAAFFFAHLQVRAMIPP